MLQRGHSGDVCDLVLTLCMYDLRKSDLFVLGLVSVRVRRGSISTELLVCGGGVRNIFLLLLVARLFVYGWMYMAHDCIWMYVYGACLFLCLL